MQMGGFVMKTEFIRVKEQLRTLTERAFRTGKRVWNGYGYYISLACLLTLFGTAAYLYRTGENAANAALPTETPAVAVFSRGIATAEPTPAPTPYLPMFTMPVNGDITQAYSTDALIWNETLGQWRVHNGIDIAANAGTAVCASESGVVTGSYEDDMYGIVIEITHEDGWVSRYCSLEAISVDDIGATVEKGEIIGSIGSSAAIESGDGAHLHFEILKNGEYVEPEFE